MVILFVEDDYTLREVTAMGLEREGFRVVRESDGVRALSTFRAPSVDRPFDAVVLDIMLPSLDGVTLCREIRKESMVPVVMVTAKTGMDEAIAALEAGADDYIRKPFYVPELVARLRAMLRRAHGARDEDCIQVGDVIIDPRRVRVRRGGRDISLTATEFRLLVELARRPGQVFTRQLLLERVWDHRFAAETRLVDMAINRLRSKVEADPSAPRLIATVRGLGYRVNNVESQN